MCVLGALLAVAANVVSCPTGSYAQPSTRTPRISAISTAWAQWGTKRGRYEYVAAQRFFPGGAIVAEARYRLLQASGRLRYYEVVARGDDVRLTFGVRFRWARLDFLGKVIRCYDAAGAACATGAVVSGHALFTGTGRLVHRTSARADLVGRIARVKASVGARRFGWASYANFGRNLFHRPRSK